MCIIVSCKQKRFQLFSETFSLPTAGSLRFYDNEFQTDGPATEKASRSKRTQPVASAVRPEVVGWRIWDATEMWLWSVGGRSRSGTGVLGLSNSFAPWRWAYTWLPRIRRANAAQCAAQPRQPRSYFSVPLTIWCDTIEINVSSEADGMASLIYRTAHNEKNKEK